MYIKVNDMEKREQADVLIKKFGQLASAVVDEIVNALMNMYIYDNSEAHETRESKVEWWNDVQKLIEAYDI